MIQQVFAVFFTLFLLFADSGQVLYAHTCHHSNRTMFSVNDVKVCCGSCESDEVAEQLKKSGCCDIKTQWLKQNYLTDTHTYSSPQFSVPIVPIIGQTHTFPSIIVPQILMPIAQGNSPPLLLASSDIRFTQIFRI